MDKMRIIGGNSLRGTVKVSGAKNAALPILIASLLTDEPCIFENVPNLQDIRTTFKLLQFMGVHVDSKMDHNEVTLNAKGVNRFEAPYDLVRTMRASVVVLGPLLARFGEAKVSLPGGCAIGARPINYHLAGLEKMGARINLDAGYVRAIASKLKGARIALEFPSVGATQNLMMAATLAEGETILENCAKEPENVDLARVLRAMGAEIYGEGTEVIRIQGKPKLHGCRYQVMGDRIEAGTYLSAALATGGQVRVEGISSEVLESVLVRFEEAGAKIQRDPQFIELASHGRPKAVNITTLPYPGFPTDMQAQFMAVMAVAEGSSVITETIFENRFMHVPELQRLGANITIRGNIAVIQGQPTLKGAPLMATDLRASASLLIGGLVAEGETIVNRIYHLDRGYEGIEAKLSKLGAEIERVK